ncbi:glycoside hydrolase family 97 N-terminal domain-containing protein [Sphingomonas sediminicola]|uniref:glycoside hydrolase family 97 N-terminal domain-containing protein n=1 Tax=Sphingomonas sediminicola TaxID=386874 RepID=UPI001FE4B5F1|nr:glycoside hydrolase family 97 N-terminal domain-containing protein [Sphingomonas sediminicola]
MTLLRMLAAFVLCLVAVPAAAQDVAQAAAGSRAVAGVDSPSGTIHVDVTLNPEGRVGYKVSRLGKPVITESRLGFLFTDAPRCCAISPLLGSRPVASTRPGNSHGASIEVSATTTMS